MGREGRDGTLRVIEAVEGVGRRTAVVVVLVVVGFVVSGMLRMMNQMYYVVID